MFPVSCTVVNCCDGQASQTRNLQNGEWLSSKDFVNFARQVECPVYIFRAITQFKVCLVT